jgi:hypothetical protein
MPQVELRLGSRKVTVHKSALHAKFEDRTVLTSDVWQYVELWLRRENSREASFYWSQSKEFYLASQTLAPVSAPLTLYYCFLNAVKALLVHEKVQTSPRHGVSGRSTTKKSTLSGEQVKMGNGGVAATLARFLGEADTRSTYSMKQILYNLPYIHRAYTLTYRKQPELFIPVRGNTYVLKEGSSEGWLRIEPDDGFGSQRILSDLPTGFERDAGVQDKLVLRPKFRFRWHDNDENALRASLVRLSNYNRRMRTHLHYIRGSPPTWYLKAQSGSADVIHRSPLTLTFIAMHRLSELARYEPLKLKRLLETQQNWLLSEFIGSAAIQFLDEVASEITGQNLALPFVRGSR